MTYFELIDEQTTLPYGKYTNRRAAVLKAVSTLLESGETNLRIAAEKPQVHIYCDEKLVYTAVPWSPKRAPNGRPKRLTERLFKFVGHPTNAMWREWTERAELDSHGLSRWCPAPLDGYGYIFYIDIDRRYISHKQVGKPAEEARRLMELQPPAVRMTITFAEGGYCLCEKLPPPPENAVAGFLAMREHGRWRLLGKRYENRILDSERAP